jgi:hypothetical protein
VYSNPRVSVACHGNKTNRAALGGCEDCVERPEELLPYIASSGAGDRRVKRRSISRRAWVAMPPSPASSAVGTPSFSSGQQYGFSQFQFLFSRFVLTV